jgi:hypothetical protein
MAQQCGQYRVLFGGIELRRAVEKSLTAIGWRQLRVSLSRISALNRQGNRVPKNRKTVASTNVYVGSDYLGYRGRACCSTARHHRDF